MIKKNIKALLVCYMDCLNLEFLSSSYSDFLARSFESFLLSSLNIFLNEYLAFKIFNPTNLDKIFGKK